MNRTCNILFIVLLSAAMILLQSCNHKESLFEKSVAFPENATLEEKIDLASRVSPTPQQLEWQKLEMTAFIHFGINTFTNREWGDGKESPSLFDPVEFNAFQWVRVLQDAGLKMLILTAKHHDGFCLWPTSTTDHSVAASPWRDGKGDLVKEVKQACDSLGMKFGVYVSPWDMNAPSYGDSPKYNEMFRQQLTELLSNYGKIDEVWLDGACGEGPNGKKQEYDWSSYFDVIRRLQPDAVVAIQGEDIRWVGTETGYGRATEWSVTAYAPGAETKMTAINSKLGLTAMSEDLGSRNIIAKAENAYWYPAEVDVSIRPGWFWHEEENQHVKSLEKLVDIYFNSVGMNAVLLLNIPPDNTGLINEADIIRLHEFGNWVRNTFSKNMLSGAKSVNKKAAAAIDNNPETYWQTKHTPESAEYHFAEAVNFDIIELQEYIKMGQRVEEFRVEAYINGDWQEVASGTTIGYKRLLQCKPITTNRIRFIIEKARGQALISNFSLYKAENIN